jgi:hypothetical protein
MIHKFLIVKREISCTAEAHARQLKGKNTTNKTLKPFMLSLSKRERQRSSFDKLKTNGQICGKSVITQSAKQVDNTILN